MTSSNLFLFWRAGWAAVFFAGFPAILFAEEAGVMDVPPAMEAQGIPPIPLSQVEATKKYTGFGTSTLCSWHPAKRAVIVASGKNGVLQLHQIDQPGGKRSTLTDSREPVRYGVIPGDGSQRLLLYNADRGGDENFQIYSMDLRTRETVCLTDGQSRNTGLSVSTRGDRIAFASTARNGRDADICLAEPGKPGSARCLLQRDHTGWSAGVWSPDDSLLTVRHSIFSDDVRLYVLRLKDGELIRLTGRDEKIYITNERFSRDGRSLYAISDDGSDFLHLVTIDLETHKRTPLIEAGQWDVQSFELSSDGRTMAYLVNEDGFSKLYLLDLETLKHLPVPDLPGEVIGNLRWHPVLRELGLTAEGSQGPKNVYSLDVDKGVISAWTAHGKKGVTYVKPELVRLEGFDGLGFSALVYRPDPGRFPGPRPVIIQFHGGPQLQWLPGFRGTDNYFLNELGIALVYPNIRGSLGYGRRFLTLDNGLKRGDSVRDAGTVIDFVRADPQFDDERVAVRGGSYGGYMVLASMVAYNDKIRCGLDSVGIANIATFLKNTADYRRPGRRFEYGDERDPDVLAFLERTAPANNAGRIKAPLFIVQGKNDPRVPVSEAELIRDAVQAGGGTVWYLCAQDEGHGFRKTVNSRYYFQASVAFFKRYLLGEGAGQP